MKWGVQANVRTDLGPGRTDHLRQRHVATGSSLSEFAYGRTESIIRQLDIEIKIAAEEGLGQLPIPQG